MKRDRAREIVQDTMRTLLSAQVDGRWHCYAAEMAARGGKAKPRLRGERMWFRKPAKRLRFWRMHIMSRALHHTTSRPIRQHVRKSLARG